MKKFTIELVNSFKVGKDSVRVALAKFSDEFAHEFFLDQNFTREFVVDRIQGLTQRKGGTKIGQALKSIRKYFAAAHGGRKADSVSQNLLLITDGKSDDDVEEEAYALRSMGVEVFAIGIGDIRMLELLQIAGTPKRMFTVEKFDDLEKIRQEVIKTVCDSKPEPQTAPGQTNTRIFSLFHILADMPPSCVLTSFLFLQTAASTSRSGLTFPDEAEPTGRRWPAARPNSEISSQTLSMTSPQ